jgi:choline monooxygenase
MNVEVTRNILTDDVLSRFSVATEEGSGLPNACYTSADWLKAENERLFARTWMLAGFCHDVSKKGDVCPVELAGMPLLVLRDNDDQIQVFHNVCRHRGAVIVPEKCSGQRILTCPYHAWAYGLDGKLRSRPHFFGGDKHDTDPGPDAPSLVPVRHAVWHDLIFVNISGDAVPFEEHWEPFSRRTKDYDFSALRYARTLEFDVKGNWKLILENFFDAYHVPSVHPKLEEFAPIHTRIGTQVEGPWFHNTNPISEPQEGRGQGMPFYPGLDAVGQRTEWYFHLFPTTLFEIWPDQLAVFQLHALEPGRTIEKIHMYFIGEGATEQQYEPNRQGVYDMWDELNTEDFKIVENMQMARSSPAFDGGALSPFWDPATQHFAKLMAQGMR